MPPALLALKAQTAEKLPHVQLVPQESPVGEHQSNGVIECAIREISRTARVLKSATEARYGRTLGERDPLLAWMVQHSAAFNSRYAVAADGRTAWELAQADFQAAAGKRATGGGPEDLDLPP